MTTLQVKKRKALHVHRWVGYITFRCKCGVRHRDRVFVGIDGHLLIDRSKCP